jgi:hypothetical protein
MMKFGAKVDRREDMSKIWRHGSVSLLSFPYGRSRIDEDMLRSAQVETQLNKTKDSKKSRSGEPNTSFLTADADTLFSSSFQPGVTATAPPSSSQTAVLEAGERPSMPDVVDTAFTLPIAIMVPERRPLLQTVDSMAANTIPDPQMMENLDLGLDANFSWEMIGLGLEEPMPMQEAIDELYDMHIVPLSRANAIIELIFTSTRYTRLCQCSIDIDTKHP